MDRIEGGVLYLDVDLMTGSQLLPIELTESSQLLEIELTGGGSGFPYYQGAYEVDPRKVEQVLETKNKSMKEDVTVHPIFYSEVPNNYGDTCYIGLE